MSIVLDGLLGITFPSGSTQNNAVANTAAINSLIGGRGLTQSVVPSGSVVQVVQTVYTNGFTTTTTGSWVATGYTASITPQSSSNKILVTTGGFNLNNGGVVTFMLGLFRGSTQIPSSNAGFSGLYYNGSGELMGVTINYLDSPSTTSPITYQLYVYMTTGGTAQINASVGAVSPVGTITLSEIAV